jgi:hypothetical protein
MKNRAQRRHDEARVVKNRVKSHTDWPECSKKDFKTTGTPCSCHMCMNERHNSAMKPKDRITMQEKQLLEKIEEDEVI